MSIVLPTLSVIHVLGAVIWAGWALSFFWFISPAVEDAGQAGTAFMQRVMNGPLLKTLIVVPVLVVLSGLILYWYYTGHLNTAVIFSVRGLALSIGALAGIAALAEGALITGPTAEKMRALGEQIARAGGPPPAGQLAEMGQLRARLQGAATRGAYFLLVAVIGMAIGGS